MAQTIKPLPVDQVMTSIIMDNSIDVLLANTDVAKRFPLGPNPFVVVSPHPVVSKNIPIVMLVYTLYNNKLILEEY